MSDAFPGAAAGAGAAAHGEGRLHIVAVTGSRADFGLMRPLYRAIGDEQRFAFSLVVTGAHLDASLGHTVAEIEAQGFAIAARVAAADAGDNAAAVSRATALGLAGFAELLPRLDPGLLLLPGDRYEILAAAIAALFAKVPVAHFFGGDVTVGAFDEAIRHAIAKIAHIHFPTNAPAALRLQRMGEDPAHIHLVGSPALDTIKSFVPLARHELFGALGLATRPRLVVVAFHPPTLDRVSALLQLEELLAALDGEGDDAAIVLTGSNADTEGRALSARLRQFAARRAGSAFHASLGQELFFSALAHAAVLVGNSSSGLYEAPSFRIPSVNIGDRQEGRLRASSVIDAPSERRAIAQALDAARRRDCSQTVNPYGDGNATQRIMGILRGIGDPRRLLKKRFCDVMGP
jgi:UDP-N-acetylglucosamine 2-epimerase (non-hydrolysing)/GDP/UDP-N,N'-diacetylbacillosamine 2-epimerase (hydrolysing)